MALATMDLATLMGQVTQLVQVARLVQVTRLGSACSLVCGSTKDSCEGWAAQDSSSSRRSHKFVGWRQRWRHNQRDPQEMSNTGRRHVPESGVPALGSRGAKDQQ